MENGETVFGFRAKGPNFSLLQIIQTDSGDYPLSYSMGNWGFFPGGKRGRSLNLAIHLQVKAGVMNKRNYNSDRP